MAKLKEFPGRFVSKYGQFWKKRIFKIADEIGGVEGAEIKRLFASTLKSAKQSRVLLNKFVSQVA